MSHWLVCGLVHSGLPLIQSSKRSHMHLSTSALSNASASLHYPMPPCHYSNQQTTYGMMAGTSTYAQLTQLREVLLFRAHVLSRIINTHRNTVCVCVCVSSTGNALCQHLSDPHPADLQCSSCQHGQRSQFTARYNLNLHVLHKHSNPWHDTHGAFLTHVELLQTQQPHVQVLKVQSQSEYII